MKPCIKVPTGKPGITRKICPGDSEYATAITIGIRQKRVSPTSFGPGTELKAMLALLQFKTCGECEALASQMDAWGVEGCRNRENRAIIFKRLAEQEAKTGWLKWALAAGLAVIHGLPTTHEGLLDEAIRRAEEKQEGEKSLPFKSEVSK